tara:strand:+ start:59 stop:445 length:387 start_codon:yes stop_codon:yes gene_type:complete
MKLNWLKVLLLCSIFGIFCVKKVYGEVEEEEGKCDMFCEILAQLISFIIGLMVRSVVDTCIENGNCGHVVGTIILYLFIFVAIYILIYLLLLLCGIDISPPKSSKSKSKYSLRTGGFAAGLLLGGKKN